MAKELRFWAAVLTLLVSVPSQASVIIDLWGGTPGSESTVSGRISGIISGTTRGGNSNIWGQDIRTQGGNWFFNQQSAPSGVSWREASAISGTDPGHSLGNSTSFIDSSVTLPAGTGDVDFGTQIGVFSSGAGLFRIWTSITGAFTHEWDGSEVFTFDGRTLNTLVSDGDTWMRTFNLGADNFNLTVNFLSADPAGGSVPVPSSIVLLGIGVLALVSHVRRQKRRVNA